MFSGLLITRIMMMTVWVTGPQYTMPVIHTGVLKAWRMDRVTHSESGHSIVLDGVHIVITALIWCSLRGCKVGIDHTQRCATEILTKPLLKFYSCTLFVMDNYGYL